MPAKSPKTKSSKSPTTSKEGKEADPLAGIENLVEDQPAKAPVAEEGKKEEIIEDVDASSFDLSPEEEAELAQALGKERIWLSSTSTGKEIQVETASCSRW